jgi:hypothetical protein
MKKLSICMVGRNDDYMPDFIYRITTTLNFIAESARIADVLSQLELVVVDWKSQEPLSTVVPLSIEAKKITRFVYVEKDDTEETLIPICTAFNLAMSEGQGEYVSLCGCDVLITASSLLALFALFENKSMVSSPESHYFSCGRFSVPCEVVDRQYSVKQWKNWLNTNSWFIGAQSVAPGFLRGGAGFLMMHRSILDASRGLNEEYDYKWGWNDIELSLRMMMKHQWYDLLSNGFIIYNMEHSDSKGTRSAAVKKQPDHTMPQQYVANLSDWGTPLKKQDHVDFVKTYDVSSSFPDSSEKKSSFSSKSEMTHYHHFKTLHQVIVSTDDISSLDEEINALLMSYCSLSTSAGLLEFNPQSKSSVYLYAYLNPYSNICLTSHWQGIDNEHGPHVIAANVSRSALQGETFGFKGYLSVFSTLGRQNFDDYLDAHKGEIDVDVVIVRGTVSIKDLNTTALAYPDALYVVANEEGCNENNIAFLTRCLQVPCKFLPSGKGVFFSKLDLKVSPYKEAGSLDPVNSSEISHYHSVIRLMNSIKEMERKKYVLWGGGTIGEICCDHIENIVAIVDKGLYLSGKRFYKNHPIILPEELTSLDFDAVLITPINHYDAILKEALQYTDRIERLHF